MVEMMQEDGQGSPPTLDEFVLQRILGSGRFAEVQVAFHTPTQWYFALKRVDLPSLRKMKGGIHLIHREMAIHKKLTQLNHANIVNLFAWFNDEDNLYLVLELFSEGNLYQKMKRVTESQRDGKAAKCMEEDQALGYAAQIVLALEAIHGAGVIHRDLKPENLLVKRDQLKVADFGWATEAGGGKHSRRCGTLDYMAPEVVKGDVYSYEVDIWSFGCILFEMLYGDPPFEHPDDPEEESDKRTKQRIVDGQPRFPASSHVSEETQQLLRTILNVDPSQRPSVGELLESSVLEPYLEKHKRRALNFMLLEKAFIKREDLVVATEPSRLSVWIKTRFSKADPPIKVFDLDQSTDVVEEEIWLATEHITLLQSAAGMQ